MKSHQVEKSRNTVSDPADQRETQGKGMWLGVLPSCFRLFRRPGAKVPVSRKYCVSLYLSPLAWSSLQVCLQRGDVGLFGFLFFLSSTSSSHSSNCERSQKEQDNSIQSPRTIRSEGLTQAQQGKQHFTRLVRTCPVAKHNQI